MMIERSVTSLSDYVVAAVDIANSMALNAWWRGHSDSSWQLCPAVHRRSGGRQRETNSCLLFKRAAPQRYQRCPGAQDFAGWLQLMQHYGLPTRLLDWTESPLSALWFALEVSGDKPAIVWAFNRCELNKAQTGEFVLFNPVNEPIAALIRPAFNLEYVEVPDKNTRDAWRRG